MVRVGGRGDNVGFAQVVLIHISRRRISRRKYASLIIGSGLGC